MKKYKYNIGDSVRVTKKSYMGYDKDGNRRVYTFGELKEPLIGKICGMKRKFLGKYKQASHSWEYQYSSDVIEQSYLKVEGSVLFYEVKQGMLNKSILVLEENIIKIKTWELALHFRSYNFPLLYSTFKWSEKERKLMSEYSKSFPRDSKGKFC